MKVLAVFSKIMSDVLNPNYLLFKKIKGIFSHITCFLFKILGGAMVCI